MWSTDERPAYSDRFTIAVQFSCLSRKLRLKPQKKIKISIALRSKQAYTELRQGVHELNTWKAMFHSFETSPFMCSTQDLLFESLSNIFCSNNNTKKAVRKNPAFRTSRKASPHGGFSGFFRSKAENLRRKSQTHHLRPPEGRAKHDLKNVSFCTFMYKNSPWVEHMKGKSELYHFKITHLNFKLNIAVFRPRKAAM